MILPEPWFTPTPEQRTTLEREARVEIGPGHELYGREFSALARCSGCDSILFRLDDETWAIVHLTWKGEQEMPPWPSTTRLGDFVAVDLVVSQHEH
jgi:hypothetical protein